MKLWTKTHPILRTLFPNYIWKINTREKKVFLTFDDGPTPEVTEWTLNQLKEHNAQATFFCIGENIQKHSEIFNKILVENHSIGNHTFNHLKGWKTSTKDYIENTKLCQSQFTIHHLPFINLFRPPYGKIKPSQSRKLRKKGYKIIMWDLISYDFNQTISKEKCLENVVKNVKCGSIIVFHDSKKAWHHLEYALPRLLNHLTQEGYTCEKLV